jgi:hypothetical protein
MSASIAALLGGMAGGFIVGLWHGWQRDKAVQLISAGIAGLQAEHDEVVRGLIERIKELEAER